LYAGTGFNAKSAFWSSKVALNFVAGKGGGRKETQRKKVIILAKNSVMN
jgi:hypothetical protein